MTPFAGLQWLSSVLFVGVVALGTVVSLQAFRGYRRSDEPTMRYFAIGLALVLVVAPIVGIGGEIALDAIGGESVDAAVGALALEQGLRFLGVCALVYALYAKRRF